MHSRVLLKPKNHMFIEQIYYTRAIKFSVYLSYHESDFFKLLVFPNKYIKLFYLDDLPFLDNLITRS